MARRIPPRLRSLLLSTLALWAAFNVYYLLGASGVGSRGGKVAVDRSRDVQLFRIDDRYALRTTDGESFDLVTIQRGTFPVCPLCGIWERRDFVVHGVGFRNGDWFIANYVSPDGAEAFNIATGASVQLDSGPGRVLEMDGSPTAAARTRDTLGAFRGRARPISVEGTERVAAVKESCIVANAGLLLIFVSVAIAAGVGWLRSADGTAARA